MRIANIRILMVLVLVVCWVNPGLSQITAFLDDDFFFVLSGQGEEVSGVDIQSPQGGLVPAENRNAAPFTFMLSNTPNQITYGNLGSTTMINGLVKLTAGFNPEIADVTTTVAVGIGPTPIDVPFTIGPCESCPPPILRAKLNDESNLVLNGLGQELTDITFRSVSGSLRPATTPAPFSETSINTVNEVKLASPGSRVTLDGEVVLGVGWSDHLYTRDIEYEYQLIDDGEATTVGPLTLRNSDYSYSLPRFPRLDVFVNESDNIVFRGAGQPVTSLSIKSTPNSLIPSDDPGPFDSYVTNTAGEITFQSDAPLVLDGEVVLPVKWDWQKPKNIQISYDQLGELPSQVVSILQHRFPFTPEAGKEPLLITLDENNNFVITGIGQEVLGIDFSSPSGVLRPSKQTELAPFPLTLSNEADHISLGVLGGVVIDGSFVMDFGPTDPSLLDEITINVGFGPIATLNPPNVDCERCDYPTIVVEEDRGFVLDGLLEPVTELKFTSKFGGFSTLESVPEGLTLISSTENELIVGNEAGLSGASLDGLQAVWGSSFDNAVFVNFTFIDGTSFGPLPLDLGSPVVPEPSGGLMAAFALMGMLGWRRSRKS